MAQTQNVFKEIQVSDSNKLVFSTISDGDVIKALDIRTWWLDGDEWRVTKKGVRIKQEYLGEALSSIIENIDSDTKFDILGLLDI